MINKCKQFAKIDHKAIRQFQIKTEMVKYIKMSLKAVFVIIKGKSFCSSTANNSEVMGSVLKLHRLTKCALLLVAFDKGLTNVNSYSTKFTSKTLIFLSKLFSL